jgi:hypothetical protein
LPERKETFVFRRRASLNICSRYAGLPDSLFSDQKSKFWHILDDLGMESVVIYLDSWNILLLLGIFLWAFGNFVVILLYSLPALVYCIKTNLATLAGTDPCKSFYFNHEQSSPIPFGNDIFE